jgi:uncharacterized SAM-binding protein YcdF (DUF218 family)
MNKIVRRVIFLVLGLIGLVWFLLPYAVYRILNIGNLTGLLVSLLLFLIAVFQKQLDKAIGYLWRKGFGKVILLIVGAIISVVVILVILMSTIMIREATDKPQQNSTLIVLGCKVNSEQPTLMLEERLQAAFSYLVQNPEAVAVLSGGQGPGEDISEAECMYRYLTGKGIDGKRLYKEDRSTSTRENVLFSHNIIEEKHLNSNIAIVTNEFHEYRANIIAKALGYNASAVSAKTERMLFPTFYVRKLYGILYEWFL